MEAATLVKTVIKKRLPRIVKWYRKWAESRAGRHFSGRSPAEVFAEIHDRNYWGDSHSVSGGGSNLEQTAQLREFLPLLIREHGIRSLLDLPCGDFFWMKEVDLGSCEYVGADIVDSLVQSNQQLYGRPGRNFLTLDLIADQLPPVDLIFCRDCLVHLSVTQIRQALANLFRSGARYLLTTTFPQVGMNREIVTGQWRPLNLQRFPFDFPAPLRLFNEGCTQQDGEYGDKSLGLWRLDDLAVAASGRIS